MAGLHEVVSRYKDELRDGIAWIVFWKKGRSWSGEYLYLDTDDFLSPGDKEYLEEIRKADPAAVVLNGYYCGYLSEEMSIKELTDGVRCHYENHYNGIDSFISSHVRTAKQKPNQQMAEHREQSQRQRTGERGALSVEILEDRKKLEQTIKVLEQQIGQDVNEMDRLIHTQVLEAYRRALNNQMGGDRVETIRRSDGSSERRYKLYTDCCGCRSGEGVHDAAHGGRAVPADGVGKLPLGKTAVPA